jgi:hypothetical protein
VKNEWTCTFTAPTRLHVMDRDNFAFTFTDTELQMAVLFPVRFGSICERYPLALQLFVLLFRIVAYMQCFVTAGLISMSADCETVVLIS